MTVWLMFGLSSPDLWMDDAKLRTGPEDDENVLPMMLLLILLLVVLLLVARRRILGDDEEEEIILMCLGKKFWPSFLVMMIPERAIMVT